MKIKDILLMAVATTAILTGCNNKESKVETTEFVDDVKVALADSGRIDLSKLQWRPVAAHVLSLPERQCPCAADEDKGEILQLRCED